MSLLTELVLRVVLVITLDDAIYLYAVARRGLLITAPIVIGLILITIIVLLINIFFCFSKRGINLKKVGEKFET